MLTGFTARASRICPEKNVRNFMVNPRVALAIPVGTQSEWLFSLAVIQTVSFLYMWQTKSSSHHQLSSFSLMIDWVFLLWARFFSILQENESISGDSWLNFLGLVRATVSAYRCEHVPEMDQYWANDIFPYFNRQQKIQSCQSLE